MMNVYHVLYVKPKLAYIVTKTKLHITFLPFRQGLQILYLRDPSVYLAAAYS